jgi:hypothetical protein
MKWLRLAAMVFVIDRLRGRPSFNRWLVQQYDGRDDA